MVNMKFKLTIVILFLRFVQVSTKECPTRTKSHTGLPSFSTKPATEFVTVRFGHFTELDCCMYGFHEIIWSRLNRTAGVWEVLNTTNTDLARIEFIDNRQVMVIKSAENDDEGSYRCFARQNDTTFEDISRKYTVEVIACDPLARGPYAIAPLPCESTMCTIGSDLTLPCNGYFGCNDGSDVQLVEWFVLRDENGDSDWIPAQDFDSRYKVTYSYPGNGAEIRTNLTILSVKKLDTRLRFRCTLASSQILNGRTDIHVKLVAPTSNDMMTTETASFGIVAIAGGGAVLVVIILIFVGVTVAEARKTRKHLSRDMERKISGDSCRRPFNYTSSKLCNEDII